MASLSNTRTGRPPVRPPGVRRPAVRLDYATLSGVVGGFAVIGLAVYLGGAVSSFLNLPGILIVLLGTLFVTTISFNMDEMLRAQKVMRRALLYHAQQPNKAAQEMLGLAEQARHRTVLDLQNRLPGLAHSGFLQHAISLVIDGLPADEIERLLEDEVRETARRHMRAVGVLQRAGEVAPAMGLIGTLVGLVQMLGNLEDPGAIGPAMAVALLTTFYGAVLANMVFNPLASKLERNSEFEIMVNRIYTIGAAAISRQDNPRRLEMTLNTILPPAERVRFFD